MEILILPNFCLFLAALLEEVQEKLTKISDLDSQNYISNTS
jgi:hypothetical protein